MESQLGSRKFVIFHVDVALGDEALTPLEKKSVSGFLATYGYPDFSVPLINSHQQFAEKLHAYTLAPEGRENTRTKDLVDMVLLIKSGRLDISQLDACLQEVFQKRKSHVLPNVLPKPPVGWEKPYGLLAKECHLEENLDEAFLVLQNFLEGRSSRSL